jgi:hypothetical protein
MITIIRYMYAPERCWSNLKIIQYNVSWTIARNENEPKECRKCRKYGLVPHEDPVNKKQAKREKQQNLETPML